MHNWRLLVRIKIYYKHKTHTLFWKQNMKQRMWMQFSSVQFSHSVVSDSLHPHGLQHARLPCPSPMPGAYWNSWPSSQWCHPTISSSVVTFSSWLQSSPASGSFPMSQFFPSGRQSIGISASASVLTMNIQDFFSIRNDWSNFCIHTWLLEKQ